MSTQNLHVGVYSSFSLNCQTLEAIKMSFSRNRQQAVIHTQTMDSYNSTKKKSATKVTKEP